MNEDGKKLASRRLPEGLDGIRFFHELAAVHIDDPGEVIVLLALAVAARGQGLQTGILWGLPARLAAGVEGALASGDLAAAVKVGWDPTHTEMTGLTIAAVKAGARPAFAQVEPAVLPPVETLPVVMV